MHRAARRYATSGLRGSRTLWKYVQRVQPLPREATLRAGAHNLRLDLAGDIVDVPLYVGDYERAEQVIAQRCLERGAVFVDVGANRGLYTALALAAGATVIALEPHPALAAELRKHFPTARVEEVAAADKSGTATLHVFPDSLYLSTIRTDRIEGTAAIEVPVVRLDDLLAGIDRIDLMKVDVEGVQAAVLIGASELFKAGIVRAAIIEVNVDHARTAAMLDEWGYRSRLIAWRGRVRRRAVLLPTNVASGVPGNYLIESPLDV